MSETLKPTMQLRIKVLASGDDLGEDQFAFMFGMKHPAHAKPAIIQQLWDDGQGKKEWRDLDEVS